MPPHYPRKRLGDEQVCEGCHMWATKTAVWDDPVWYHAGTHAVRYTDEGDEGDHDIPAGAVVHKDVNEAWKHAIKHWDEGKSGFPRVYKVHASNVTPQGSHAVLNAPHEGHEVAHDHEKHPPLRSKYDDPDDPILFHGTTKEEHEDDPEEITPGGGDASFGPGIADPHYAYATPSLSDAWDYAEKRAQNGRGGKPTVYRVTPKNPGDVEKDPSWAGDYSRGNNEHDKRSRTGFHLLDEVPMSQRQEHEWAQSPFNAEDEDWHHEGARIAALNNPTGEIRGHEPSAWYHGSPHEFEEFGEGGREHWNTYLGTHFSAQPEVAAQFAEGGHHEADELDDEPAGHIVHAKLHIRRPKTYRSEYEMDQAAHEWAHGKGMLIGKHIAEHPEDYAEPEEDEDEDYYADPEDHEHEQIRQAHLAYAAREDKPFGRHESDFGFPTRNSWRPAATGWLNSHPRKEEIAQGFKNHLKSQGYDGVVYGNEVESDSYDRGSKYPPYDTHPPLDMPDAHQQAGEAPQHNISAIAFEPHQVEITRHEYHPDYKTWEQRHPQDLQHPLPGMERTASKRYYHGTTQVFQPGDLVTGEHELGRKHSDPGYAFVTGIPQAAHDYGRHKAQGQWVIGNEDAEPHAYEVEPTGPIEPDDTVDERFDAWRSTSPFRVVRRLEQGRTASTAEEYARQDAGKQDVWQVNTGGRTQPLCSYHRDVALEHDRAANSLASYFDLGQAPSGAVSGPERGSCAQCGANTPYLLQTMTREVSRHRDSQQPRKRRSGPYVPTQTKPFTPVIQSTSSWDDDEEEPETYHCPACGEDHEDEEERERHMSTYTDWDQVYPHLNSSVHRVLPHMKLPRHVQDVVHDESRPMRERGESLLGHVQENYGHGLGMHWSDVFGEGHGHGADKFAGVGGGDSGDTQVVLHAHKPAREHIEEDPDTLDDQQVYGYDVHDENEVPIQRRAPVHVTGISWRPGGYHQEWKHHHLDKPMEMTAMRKQAHDATENQDLRHCPFCGSGKILGRADGTVECEFCHNYFTVQVQPQYPNFPQTINGEGTPPPGMPGEVEEASMEDGQPGEGGEFPPGGPESDAEAAGGEGVPSDLDESDSAQPEEGGAAEDSAPPFAKKSFRTVTGARLNEDAYVRHLAIALASDPARMAATIKADRGM